MSQSSKLNTTPSQRAQPVEAPTPKKILFICLANTGQSPMAESIMRSLVKKNELDWEVDSAGLRSWNVGYYPEKRCLKVLAEYGLTSDHLGRELHEGDYHNFDHIFAMDKEVLEELQNRAPSPCKAKIEHFGNYLVAPESKTMIDPYFERGIDKFRKNYKQLSKCCNNFLCKELLNKK